MMVEAVAVSRCHGQRTRPEAVALAVSGWVWVHPCVDILADTPLLTLYDGAIKWVRLQKFYFGFWKKW